MSRTPQRVEIAVPVRTLVTISIFGGLVLLVVLSIETLLSILVGGGLAVGRRPLRGPVGRRRWKRGLGPVAVFAGLFAAVFVIVLVTAGPLWDQITEFVQSLPAYWDELTQQDWFQTFIQTGNADDKIRDLLKDLAAGLPDAATAELGIAGSVFGSVLSLVTLTFLALFLLMERPAITDWLFGFAPPEVDRRWRPVLEDSISGISSSLVGNVAISIIAATVAGVSAGLLGLPFPIVLAVITGFLDLTPQVGATIAAIILVAVALTVSTPAAIAMVVIQLIYQQVENYIVYPVVYRRAVELSGFTTIVAVLIAGSLLGVVGAILAVPFAAVIKIVLREAGAPRRARMAALRGGAAGAVAPMATATGGAPAVESAEPADDGPPGMAGAEA